MEIAAPRQTDNSNDLLPAFCLDILPLILQLQSSAAQLQGS